MRDITVVHIILLIYKSYTTHRLQNKAVNLLKITDRLSAKAQFSPHFSTAPLVADGAAHPA
jgi:hypothetical protein